MNGLFMINGVKTAQIIDIIFGTHFMHENGPVYLAHAAFLRG